MRPNGAGAFAAMVAGVPGTEARRAVAVIALALRAVARRRVACYRARPCGVAALSAVCAAPATTPRPCSFSRISTASRSAPASMKRRRGANVWSTTPPAGWSIDNSGVPARRRHGVARLVVRQPQLVGHRRRRPGSHAVHQGQRRHRRGRSRRVGRSSRTIRARTTRFFERRRSRSPALRRARPTCGSTAVGCPRSRKPRASPSPTTAAPTSKFSAGRASTAIRISRRPHERNGRLAAEQPGRRDDA